MAIDHTPPRLRLIATIAVIVLITLVSLDYVLKSYFAYMSSEAKHEKNAPKAALLAQMDNEHRAMAGSKVAIDQAMKQVAREVRPELIGPKASEDLGAMTGWSKMPKPAPVVPVVVQPSDALDAGAMGTSDASTMTLDASAASNSDGGFRVVGPKTTPAPAPHH